MIYIGLLIYVLLSAGGLIMLKLGSGDTLIKHTDNILNFSLSIQMLIGMIMYVSSFILFMFLMSKFKLSYIYPVSASIVYILVCVGSVILLKEQLSFLQIMGMILILGGILAITLAK